MKLITIIVAVASFSSTILSRSTAPLVVLLFFLAFGLYGVANSVRLHIDPFNDVPNAFRVLLAGLGGYLLGAGRVFIYPSVGILLVFASVVLNDEYQRRTIDSLRRGKRGGSVAFLGIDGSGKSSHAALTATWLTDRGCRTTLMPFHRYLFVEKLSSLRSTPRRTTGSPRRGGNPLRPLFSLVDNILLELSSSFGSAIEGRVVLYDRFIWSTYIKYYALGYPVRPIRELYLLPRPRFALVLDVPVAKSLGVIDSREMHIRYPKEVLQRERDLYLQIARRRGYPVIDSSKESTLVQAEIERYLGPMFPVAGGRTK